MADKHSAIVDISSVVHPLPLRVKVEYSIREMIVSGQLNHGDHLVESDLATPLGVSRIPVREALQVLASDGWVDLRSGYGAFVHTPTTKEIEDVFSVRMALESEGAEQAALRVASGAVTKEARQRLESIVRRGSEEAQRDKKEGFVDHNALLHAAVIELSGNQALSDLVDVIEAKVRWYFSAIATRRAPASWVEHESIVTAILTGEAPLARKLMATHCRTSRQGLIDLLSNSETSTVSNSSLIPDD